jgi:bis(5'-nucleosidyl)-tetraphosphatase
VERHPVGILGSKGSRAMTASGSKAANRFSAGAVVVRRDAGGHSFLLLRAYRNWDFPKGEVGEGEEPLAAARREVSEETGIVDLVFPFGTSFYETPVYSRDKVARYYLVETATERVRLGVNPELGRPEHHEFRWLRHEDARPLLVERLRAVLDWAEERLAAALHGGA